jgi:DNA-binding winged helix-turn-helix (wHTH) protein/tetratricopeptide (TPR) repeat protein
MVAMKRRWGEYELDAERFELRVRGEPVKLEPRVLEVLLYLAENAGRVVPKQELLDSVWKSRFVGESTLSAAIAEARRALGGGDPHASPIRTVHGRGYSFVVPELDRGERDATPEQAPREPSGVASARRWAPWLLGAAAAAAGLVWLVGPQDERGPAAPDSTVRLVLAPLLVGGADEELRLVALSLADLLSRRLGEVGGLELDTPGAGVPVAKASERGELRALGAGAYLVAGELAPSTVPGRARLRLDLWDFRGAEEPAPVRLSEHDVPFLSEPGDLARFVVLRDSIARQVLERLLPAVTLGPKSPAPRHPEAYRLYLQALQPLRQAVCVGPAALALLERSVALDPAFAPAWGELGWARYNSASSCGESGDNYELALTAARRALAQDPGWPRALGLVAVVEVESGRAEDAFAGLLAAERGAAAGPDVPFFESYALGYAGYLERSQALVEEALRRDPTFLADGGWTPNALLYRGEHDRFLELLPAGESPLFRFYRGLAELRRGREETARAVLAPAYAQAPNDLFARLAQALLDSHEGRSEEARTVLSQLALQRRQTGARDGEMTFKVAELYGLLGDHAKAAEQAELAIAQGFFCVPCFEGDPWLGEALADPAVSRALQGARDRHRAFGRRFALGS